MCGVALKLRGFPAEREKIIEMRVNMDNEFDTNLNSENFQPAPEEAAPESIPAAEGAPAESAPAPETAAETAAPAEPVKKKKKKKRFTLKKEFTIFAISAAFCFTVCFFAPADIFIGNQHDFAISAPRILYPLFEAACITTVALMIFLNIMLAINVRLWKIVSSLISGLLLAGYSQMMLMNGRMVSITGDAAPYSVRSKFNLANLAIFIAITLTPTLFMIISGDLKKKKKNRFHMRALTYISVALFIMQGVGIGGRLAKIGIEKSDDSQFESFFSLNGATDLSSDENIVVFLTDRLDADWMETLLDDYPELNDELADFTFYANNTSGYTNTFPAVAQMLTAHKYDGGEWVPYLDESWKGQTVPRRLHENGYTVNMLIDSSTTFSKYSNLKGQCDNIRSAENFVDYNYFGPHGILRTMAHFSLGKLSPYLVKGRLMNGYAADFSSKFYVITADIPERLDASIGMDSDMKIYQYVKKNGINANSPSKTFTFIHLDFMHDNSKALSNLYDGFEGEVDKYTTARGGFELLNTYFEEMKKAGVYDNSTIVVLGDHGHPPVEIEVDKKKSLEESVRTSLFIKPAGAKGDKLTINKEAELSNDYFPASILDFAGISHDDLGPSYNELMASGNYPERYLKVYCWHGIGNIEDILKYEISGDASDFSNWKVVERKGKPATE